MKFAVLVPAFNEELCIRRVVEDALRHCASVIVVDDGSTDRTVAELDGLPVTLIRHPRCRGKGESLRTGFGAALQLGVDGVLTMDGDGQHSAADIPRLIDAAVAWPRHIVIGARLRKRAQQPLHRRLANEFGDWGIAWACGYRVADTQSGQRFYPAEVAALADVAGQGFVFEADILIQASRVLGTRCVAVPIESRYEGTFRLSHFRPLRDLYRITRHVVGRVLSHGHVWQRYLQARRNPPIVHDPSAAEPPAALDAGRSVA
jgi:glycosyltransferase involved in cell wall biosynthesis